MKLCGRLFIGVLLAAASVVSAGELGHYVNGSEGLRAGSAPPPGIYWRNYDIWYSAPKLKSGEGKDVHVGFDLDVVASVHRCIWMTDRIKDVIGADFGMHAIVPFVYQDVDLDKVGIHDQRVRVGDIDISPAILSWHKKRYDLVLAYEVFMPTADKDEPGTPGKEFWTHMFTFGGTGYLDKEKSWTFSLLSRYEIHSQQDNTYVTPGHDFHFEWGLGKQFKQGFEVGAVGYCNWQVTEDKGRGVFWGHNRDRVHALGLEGNYFIKPIKMALSLRALKEFGAHDRPEGVTTTLTLTKRF